MMITNIYRYNIIYLTSNLDHESRKKNMKKNYLKRTDKHLTLLMAKMLEILTWKYPKKFSTRAENSFPSLKKIKTPEWFWDMTAEIRKSTN